MILLVLALLGQPVFAAQTDYLDEVVSRDGQMLSYRKWAEKNIEIVDWSNPARSQGAVGSCQSFAFLGMVENRVFENLGVTLDLSERYQLYSNFMEFGALGSNPAHIALFPLSFQKWGALPEAAYPYSLVDKNSGVFEVDSAQGLQSGGKPAILTAIEGKEGAERSAALQEEKFLGQLPAGEAPVSLPVKALKVDSARPMRFVSDKASGVETPCFTTGNETSVISLSASEFASHCLEFKPVDWKVLNQFGDLISRLSKSVCASNEQLTSVLREALEARKSSLMDLLKALTGKRAAMIAMSVPLEYEGKKSVLWDAEAKEVHAGHAVIGLGYLTFADLNSLEAQSKGLLGSGLFDKMATKLDPSFARPTAGWSLEKLREHRVNSVLGQRVKAEQGIIITRNSWGEVPGLGGYQAITFDYYLAHLMMLISSPGGYSVGDAPAVEVSAIAVDRLTKEARGHCGE